MNNKIEITATDGKVFRGTIDDYARLVNEFNAYESNLASKKAKEEEERKAREAKEMELSQYRTTKLKEINEVLQKAKVMVDEYETKTGNKLMYTTDLTTGDMTITEVSNTLYYAWNNFYDDIFLAFHER